MNCWRGCPLGNRRAGCLERPKKVTRSISYIIFWAIDNLSVCVCVCDYVRVRVCVLWKVQGDVSMRFPNIGLQLIWSTRRSPTTAGEWQREVDRDVGRFAVSEAVGSLFEARRRLLGLSLYTRQPSSRTSFSIGPWSRSELRVLRAYKLRMETPFESLRSSFFRYYSDRNAVRRRLRTSFTSFLFSVRFRPASRYHSSIITE